MELLKVLLAPAGITAILAVCTYVYAIRKDKKEEPDRKLDESIERWKTIMGGSIAELTAQVDRQAAQIVQLKDENDRLEIIVRSLTHQNMEVAHELSVERQEHKDLAKRHNQLIGRLEGRGDVA